MIRESLAMVAAFALAAGGRAWLGERGSPESDLSMTSEAVGTIAAPESLPPTHPDAYLSLEPNRRLLGIAQWAANARRSEIVAWLHQKPACTELEWRVLLVRWAELDRTGFAEKAKSLTEEDPALFSGALIEAVQDELADHEVRRRPRRFLASNDNGTNDAGPHVSSAYEAWLLQDFSTALETIMGMEDDGLRMKLLGIAAKIQARTDPVATLQWVLDIAQADPDQQRALLKSVLSTVAASDHQAAWTLIKHHTDDLLMTDREDVFALGIDELLKRIAFEDPADLLTWIAGLDDEKLQRELIDINHTLTTRAEDVPGLLEILPPGEVREALALGILAQQQPNFEQRMIALSDLEGLDHDRALGTLLRHSMFSFHQIAETVDEWQHLPPEVTDGVVKTNVSLWAARNPGEAFDWLQSLPDGLANPPHYEALWQQWMRTAPNEASTTLLEITHGSRRDGAIRGLLDQVALGKGVVVPDFDVAWRWANTLTDPEVRRQLMGGSGISLEGS